MRCIIIASWICATRAIFTGDTFGLSYREFDTERGAVILPTTTPTQFDPEQLVASIDRIAGYRPEADVSDALQPRHGRSAAGRIAEDQVRELAEIARRHADGDGAQGSDG